MSENIKKGDDSTYPRRNRIIDVTANKSADTAAGIAPRRRAFVIMRRSDVVTDGCKNICGEANWRYP